MQGPPNRVLPPASTTQQRNVASHVARKTASSYGEGSSAAPAAPWGLWEDDAPPEATLDSEALQRLQEAGYAPEVVQPAPEALSGAGALQEGRSYTLAQLTHHIQEARARRQEILASGDPDGPDLASWGAGDLEEQQARPISKSDLASLERQLDALFKSAGLDIDFTRHFLDRVNDKRNVTQITVEELSALFSEVYKQHAKLIAKQKPDWTALLKDLSTDVNVPFVLDVDRDGLVLVATTVMRKRKFHTRGGQRQLKVASNLPKRTTESTTLAAQALGRIYKPR